MSSFNLLHYSVYECSSPYIYFLIRGGVQRRLFSVFATSFCYVSWWSGHLFFSCYEIWNRKLILPCYTWLRPFIKVRFPSIPKNYPFWDMQSICKGALLFQAQIMGTKSFHSKLKLISNLTHQQHQRPRCVHCLHLPFYFLVFDA